MDHFDSPDRGRNDGSHPKLMSNKHPTTLVSLVPGPCSVHPDVLSALSLPPLDHRTAEYGEILADITSILRTMFGTQAGDVFVVPATGTQTLEATIRNLAVRGHSIVVPFNGHMGQRLTKLASIFDCPVRCISSPLGNCLNWERISSEITEGALVTVVHHESSTGFTNNLHRLGALCRERDAVIVVDAISSAGSLPINMDKAGIDVVVATSQKGVGSVAGLGIIVVGPRAWKRFRDQKSPKTLAWDWSAMKEEYERNPRRSPWTPSANLMRALHCSLSLFQDRGGIIAAVKRKTELSLMLRRSLTELGFKVMVAGDGAESGPIIAAYPPSMVSANDLRQSLHQDYGIIVSGGQGMLRGQVLRFALFGDSAPQDVGCLLDALKQLINRNS